MNQKTLVAESAAPAFAPRPGRKVRVVGILLLYYPDYAAHAIAVFAELLKSLSPDYGIVVVNNGNLQLPPRDDVVAVVAGENSLREFSGWRAGLDHCQETGWTADCDLLVFANDTFCHHNRFGVFTRAAFRESFNAAMAQPGVPMMAGEAFRLGKPYALDGLSSRSWICTYLFAWNRAALSNPPELTPPLPMERFYSRKNGELTFSGLVSDNLSKHIISWLTGSGNTSWKGLGATGVNGLEKLQGKANSILCEKYFSASAVSKGVQLIDVFSKNYWKRLRVIESVFAKCQKWLGSAKSETYSK